MESNIDTQLELAISTGTEADTNDEELYTGYESYNNSWSLLIRYSDNISDLAERYLEKIIYLLANYAIIEIKEQNIEPLAGDSRIIYIEKPKTVNSQVSYAQYASCLGGTFINNYGLRGKGTFISVIDSGIDISHQEFLRNGVSRIYELWDLQAEYSPENGNIYGMGHIYSNENLNEILRYKYDGQTPGDDISGHGTEVCAIAAGTNMGVAPDADIIVIRLGSAASGKVPTTLGIVLGIDYSIRRSIELKAPVAVNLSYGNNYGSHNGVSLIENYINDVSSLAQCTIVTGTGNDGINRRHQQLILGNSSYRMSDILVSDYVTSFNIQLWKNYNDIFDVFIIAPDGSFVLTLSESQNIGISEYKNTYIKGIYGSPNPYNRNQEVFITFERKKGYIDKGQWKIMLYPKKITDGVINAYLPLRAALSGNVEFLNPTEFGTLTIPGTAEGLISVSAYDENTDDFAYFSGRGYTANNRIKPDIAAPGVDIYTAYPGNNYTFASGTSMAAPFVTGSAALLMQWGIVNGNDTFLYGEKLKASLIRGAGTIKSAGEYPNVYVGWGTLCVEASLK